MAEKIVATVTASFTMVEGTEPITGEVTFEFDPEVSFSQTMVLEYLNITDGGPVLLPKHPPKGL